MAGLRHPALFLYNGSMATDRNAYLAKWRAKNRDKTRAANLRWYKKNRADILAKASAKSTERSEYHREYRARNRETQRVCHRAYYHSNRDKLQNQAAARGEPAAMRERVKKWRADNPGKHCEQSARREAAKINATPSWLTKVQIKEMRALYAEALLHGLHVDHIVPLRGRTVRGLHVPWNLQLLTPDENNRKSNRFETD